MFVQSIPAYISTPQSFKAKTLSFKAEKSDRLLEEQSGDFFEKDEENERSVYFLRKQIQALEERDKAYAVTTSIFMIPCFCALFTLMGGKLDKVYKPPSPEEINYQNTRPQLKDDVMELVRELYKNYKGSPKSDK